MHIDSIFTILDHLLHVDNDESPNDLLSTTVVYQNLALTNGTSSGSI